MFRGKIGKPRADIGRYQPELRVWAGERLSAPGLRLAEAGWNETGVKEQYRKWEKEQAVRKTFSSEVVRMVGEKFRKAPDFYLPAGIDKRTYHKIRTDYLYRPSRNTALKCCFGLGLDAEEAEALLRLAGYALSPSDPADLVVRFCLEKGIRELASVNWLMDSFDIRDLDGYTAE